jgi:hypothetical protein
MECLGCAADAKTAVRKKKQYVSLIHPLLSVDVPSVSQHGRSFLKHMPGAVTYILGFDETVLDTSVSVQTVR